ncbi:MAG TPA: glycosyltransferase family 1 protein [Stellaceae bacterium]|nr:glycosyltransferase family 1 protein [Stellaceae bacterium]
MAGREMTVAYDVTRLVHRYAVPSPNGIDRIDLALARHFLDRPGTANVGVYLQAVRPSLFETRGVASLLSEMDKNWRDGPPASRTDYAGIKARLLHGAPGRSAVEAARRDRPSLKRRLAPYRLLQPQALGRFLLAAVPRGAVFVHATHFHKPHLFRWLAQRPDVKPVFFIHDLLPLQFPEYFAPAHIAEHRRALGIFARRGHAAIVNTKVVEEQVRDFLRRRDRHDVPILVRPMPPDPIFSATRPDPDLAATPYFVVCGTIEPRKNHLMLLHVWRELSRQWGERTPALLVIGRRGWENENVVDLLDRSHEIRKHVVEIGDLPTADMARLIAGARALLMPSFAEGYGLPIVEARAAGTPVVASDIATFREAAPGATFRRPLDGVGWLGAIKAHAESVERRPREGGSTRDAAAYFSTVDAFIESL